VWAGLDVANLTRRAARADKQRAAPELPAAPGGGTGLTLLTLRLARRLVHLLHRRQQHRPSIALLAITTSSSINVNPLQLTRVTICRKLGNDRRSRVTQKRLRRILEPMIGLKLKSRGQHLSIGTAMGSSPGAGGRSGSHLW